MIEYSFRVIKVDKNNKCMEIEYSSTNRPTVVIGARMPYVGESLDAIVSMYAPIRWWEEQELIVEDIVEGVYGTVTPPTPSIGDKKAYYTQLIQLRLDAFASTKGYDSILSACSYAASTDPKFATEGQRAVALRDATWSAAYALFTKVTSGEIPEPSSFADIEPLLPELSWIS